MAKMQTCTMSIVEIWYMIVQFRESLPNGTISSAKWSHVLSAIIKLDGTNRKELKPFPPKLLATRSSFLILMSTFKHTQFTHTHTQTQRMRGEHTLLLFKEVKDPNNVDYY